MKQNMKNKLIKGDCIVVLKDFPDNSIDLCVTDPPYGLEFMGKDWDKALPPIDAFIEIHRVLKPGALLFSTCSPRQDLMWRMMKLLEDSGFEMKQSFISWIYKTGFPKAYDVSKGIDKKNDIYVEGKVLPSSREKGSKIFNSLNKKTANNPQSYDAKRWEGWKSITGLKPALEPILMVHKPLSESTIVDNVLRWGTGAINVDACRIPFKSKGDKDSTIPFGVRRNEVSRVSYGDYESDEGRGFDKEDYDPNERGRFPANILVSDNAIDTGEKTKSPSGKVNRQKNMGNTWNKDNTGLRSNPTDKAGYGDIGDQSRYFDLDAWAQHYGLLDVPKPSRGERDYGVKTDPRHAPKGNYEGRDLDNPKNHLGGLQGGEARNFHPTVKPVKLMCYLIALGCPKGGVVLDPFMGSGTTCIGAKKLGRKYIGIELDSNYYSIAEQRVNAVPVPLTEFFT